MEDISRDLERELAQVKPKPYKQDRKTRVLIVDDFGKMTSGEYLKKLVTFLAVASLICFIMAIVFYQLYFGLAKETKNIKSELMAAQDKITKLAAEKEVLMARLVMTGKDTGVYRKELSPPPSAEPKRKPKPAKKIVRPAKKLPPKKVVKKTPIVSKKPEMKSQISEINSNKKVSNNAATTPATKPDVKPASKPDISSPATGNLPGSEPLNDVQTARTVAIDKFTVTKDGATGDLLVRFDIRNTSKTPGDVSGRIFTLLKPESDNSGDWLVVPSVNLKEGMPAQYRKGQYFSIAHFKPVKFRIKNNQEPNLYKKASIFIYNNKGKLIFEKLINITEAN